MAANGVDCCEDEGGSIEGSDTIPLYTSRHVQGDVLRCRSNGRDNDRGQSCSFDGRSPTHWRQLTLNESQRSATQRWADGLVVVGSECVLC